jgi:hypothetical protein
MNNAHLYSSFHEHILEKVNLLAHGLVKTASPYEQPMSYDDYLDNESIARIKMQGGMTSPEDEIFEPQQTPTPKNFWSKNFYGIPAATLAGAGIGGLGGAGLGALIGGLGAAVGGLGGTLLGALGGHIYNRNRSGQNSPLKKD